MLRNFVEASDSTDWYCLAYLITQSFDTHLLIANTVVCYWTGHRV